MSYAITYSRAYVGIEAPLVSVETHLSSGLPALTIVGLPETAVKESKDRVRSAIINAGFEFPAKRITINLAPADLPKEGARFDLAIAIGLLAASGQLPVDEVKAYEFVAELALSSELTLSISASMTVTPKAYPLVVAAQTQVPRSCCCLLSSCSCKGARTQGTQCPNPQLLPEPHPECGQKNALSQLSHPRARRVLCQASPGPRQHGRHAMRRRGSCLVGKPTMRTRSLCAPG